MDSEDNNLEIITVPSSNPSHEQTPVATSPAASSVSQDESRGLNGMTPEDQDSLKKQVYEYADEDRWKEAEPIFNKYPDMVRIPLTHNKDRALHVAVKAKSITFVKGLVNLMTPQHLEIPDLFGRTAFFVAAKSGNSDLVQIMIEKNQNLPLIKEKFVGGMLPVHWAAICGHHKIVQDLSSKTLLQEMEIKDIEKLFLETIEHDMFDVATKLFEEYPAKLAIAKCRTSVSRFSDHTALEMLLRKPSKKLKGRKRRASLRESLPLLQKVWPQLEAQLGWTGILKLIGTRSLVSAMADALESGNVEAKEWLSKNVLETVDKDGNNILHFAAYPLEIEESSSSSRATTRMAKEVAWFKEQEINFPRALSIRKNNEGKKPKDVFRDKHKDLSREVKATAKEIADSGMLVAALVATVAFAAALTVPGDKTNPWFTVFILANAAALFTSSASILSFLSNFTTSRFADSEFVIALHPSLILGPILLLISVVTMVISFAAASFLIFEHTSKSAANAVALMGVFPILLFLLFQFSIFDKYLWSRFYRYL